MHSPYLRALVVGATASFISLSAHAQVVPGPPVTKSQCTKAIQAFESTRDNMAFEFLPSCGKLGGQVLARQLRQLRSETNRDALEEAYRVLSSIKDPEVFATALSIMQDPAATPEARSTAILIGVAQHDNALLPPINVPLKDLLSESSAHQCRLLHTTDARYRSMSPLPGDYIQQLGTTVDRLVSSPVTPPLVKKFAACAQPVVEVAQAVEQRSRVGGGAED